MKLDCPVFGNRVTGKDRRNLREVGSVVNFHKRAAQGKEIEEFFFQGIYRARIVHEHVQPVFSGFPSCLADDGGFSAADEQRALENIVPQPGTIVRLDESGGIQRRPLGNGFQQFAQCASHSVDDDNTATILQYHLH